MKGRVRRNQWINGVIYNGSNILLMEDRQTTYVMFKERPKPRTTVFICDGHHLRVGEIRDGSFVGRCVLKHDPMMRWGNYDRFFQDETVNVITVYLKWNNEGIEAISEELLKYINSEHIKGKILLIGHSKGGIIMYKVGEKLTKKCDKNDVAVITVSTPFGGSVMASNRQFEQSQKLHFPKMLNWIHNKLCSERKDDFDMEENSDFLKSIIPLPSYVNHIAFVSLICGANHPCESIKDYLLKVVNRWCFLQGDGMVSCNSQEEWPSVGSQKRMPNLSLLIAATHANAVKKVLSAIAEYAGGEYFFTELEAFRESKTFERLSQG